MLLEKEGAFTGQYRERLERLSWLMGEHCSWTRSPTSRGSPGQAAESLADQRVSPCRGIETVHADFRLIAATNRDLKQEVAEGRFREDL